MIKHIKKILLIVGTIVILTSFLIFTSCTSNVNNIAPKSIPEPDYNNINEYFEKYPLNEEDFYYNGLNETASGKFRERNKNILTNDFDIGYWGGDNDSNGKPTYFFKITNSIKFPGETYRTGNIWAYAHYHY